MYVSSLTSSPVSGRYIEELRMWFVASPEEGAKFKNIVGAITEGQNFDYTTGQSGEVEVHTYHCKGGLFHSDQAIQYTQRWFPDKLEIHFACVLPDKKLIYILKGFLKLNPDFESHAKRTMNCIAELYPELKLSTA